MNLFSKRLMLLGAGERMLVTLVALAGLWASVWWALS